MKATLLVLLAWLTLGCGPNMASLKWRASHDLNCGEDKLVLTPLDEDGDAWGLRGCEREAAYSWSSESGKSEWVMTKKPADSSPVVPEKKDAP